MKTKQLGVLKSYTFEFLTRARAFDRGTTDDRPTPDKIVTTEGFDEYDATVSAMGQLNAHERRTLVCANVVRPA